MPNFKDKANVTDDLVVSVSNQPSGTMRYKCPKCGSAMKPDREPGWRICASGICRERVDESVHQPEFVVDVRFPCPRCGKETKEHRDGTRICKPCGGLVIQTN